MSGQPTHAISIRQPWADFILLGDPALEGDAEHRKNFENRLWHLPPSKVGVPLYLHAGKQYDWLTWWPEPYDPARLGALLGIVKFAHCEHHADDSRWFQRPHGWLIDTAEPLPEPIPYRGRLGFFPVALG